MKLKKFKVDNTSDALIDPSDGISTDLRSEQCKNAQPKTQQLVNQEYNNSFNQEPSKNNSGSIKN